LPAARHTLKKDMRNSCPPMGGLTPGYPSGPEKG